MATALTTGKVLWRHTYSSPNGGGWRQRGQRDRLRGTNHATVALSAATGEQLWSRTLIGNNREGIDMAPVTTTAPCTYRPCRSTRRWVSIWGRRATLWALNAKTGAPEWNWDEVQNPWASPASTPAAACGTRRRSTPRDNLYIGVANPGPLGAPAAIRGGQA